MKRMMGMILTAVLILAAAWAMAEDPQVGGYVTFGRYEQDNDLTDGAEPIEWLVLDARDGQALLISRYALEAQPYAQRNTDATWETSTLRAWLNGDFLGAAFTEEERAAILPTDLDNGRSQQNSAWRTDGGRDTRDMVWLLSYAEAVRYLPTPEAMMCNMTDYAEHHGAYMGGLVFLDGRDTACWWLRSPGERQDKTAIIWYRSPMDMNCGWEKGAVRPVIRIGLGGAVPAETPAPETPEASEAPAEAPAHAPDVGDLVAFGRYEQDNDLADGAEPIEWRVLDVLEDRVLLIARYGLDAQPYNAELKPVTWETCTLRAWLNRDFLRTAFTEAEQAHIVKTLLDNTDGGNDTADRVFLLSSLERERYIPDHDTALCAPTDYAIARGAYVNPAGHVTDGREDGAWWLRSTGRTQTQAFGVFHVVDTDLLGDGVNWNGGIARPSVWVDLAAFEEGAAVPLALIPVTWQTEDGTVLASGTVSVPEGETGTVPVRSFEGYALCGVTVPLGEREEGGPAPLVFVYRPLAEEAQ